MGIVANILLDLSSLSMTKEEIKTRLINNHEDFANFILSLNEEKFIYSKEEKWTAGQQLDHIYRAVAPLSKALDLPKILLRIIIGKANRPSRSYEELVAKYQSKLQEGGKASGRFIPLEIHFAQKDQLKGALKKIVLKLCQHLDKFSEKDLDHYILPHPLLGKLTLREMLYFTIFHVNHHWQNTLKNLES